MAKTLTTPHPNSPPYPAGSTIVADGQPLVVLGVVHTITSGGGRRICVNGRKPKGKKVQMATQDWTPRGWTELVYHEINW